MGRTAQKKMPSKGAGNKTADTASLIPLAFNTLQHVDAKPDSKVTFAWRDVFDKANSPDIEGEHTKAAIASARFEEGKTSISQSFLAISREAGSLEQFNIIYKAMCTVWKETNLNAGGNKPQVPKAIRDAAYIVRQAYTYGVDPTKSGSVESLKKETKIVKDKETKEQGNSQPTPFSEAIVALGVLFKNAASEPELQQQLVVTLEKVGNDFAEVLTKAIGPTKPVKAKSKAALAA